MTVINFNSIKVRLEREMVVDSLFSFLDFNSIKVRLELRFSNLPLDYFTFQFHKGTIRTRDAYSRYGRYNISIP